MTTTQQIMPVAHDTVPRTPESLPHGLITPPAIVLERIEEERAKHPPDLFARNEQRLLNAWTIGYVFDGLCLEVIYRTTSKGPEVLAVGTDEALALRQSTPLAAQSEFETFLGYP